MVDLSAATHLLRGFSRPLRQDSNGDFIFDYRDQSYIVKNSDLHFYIEKKQKIKRDLETQIFYPGYYEHAVQFEGLAARRPIRRNEEILSVTSADGSIKIEIGRPTPIFCISLLDNDDINRELKRIYYLGMPGYRTASEIKSISELFRLFTIRVSTATETVLSRNVLRMHELAEAAVFHFAYGKGSAISFTKTWERTYYWLGRKENDEVQFPRRTYNSELISYYNLALASDSLVLGFLALYKILEYFYTTVSEESLHEKIKHQLVSPDFSHTKTKKLRELVRAIRNFESKLDELSALKLVLTKYFDKSDLRAWINDYETKSGPHFTIEKEVMSIRLKIDTSENTIIPNIASRIYSIRNALVHNKEGEIARFVPYTGQEEALHKEIQILVFLAEQLIITTGKDIA